MNSFEQRLSTSTKLMKKHPDKIPIILNLPSDIHMKKNKFLVKKTLTVGGFMCIMREQFSNEVKKYEAIFLIVNNTLLPNTMLLMCAYTNHCHKDGILYIDVRKESTFG